MSTKAANKSVEARRLKTLLFYSRTLYDASRTVWQAHKAGGRPTEVDLRLLSTALDDYWEAKFEYDEARSKPNDPV